MGNEQEEFLRGAGARRSALERRGPAYDRARHLVVRGELRPGSRLTEAELATRLGVSRTPAREAMRRLLAEGLLVPDGGGERPRVAVTPVSAEDVEQLYEAAGALEGVAARRVSSLSAAERKALARELRRRERAFRAAARVRPIDYDVLFAAHDAVHRTLMAVCAGPATTTLLETLRPRLDRYEWLYAPLIGPDFRATYAEHAAIIRAVEEGDGAKCERAVRRNWFAGGRRLAAALGDERRETSEDERRAVARGAAMREKRGRAIARLR